MNKKLALVSGIASLVLTACASQQERVTASGSYAYVKATERTHLQVPADLDAPEFSNDFAIPAVNQPDSEQMIGRNLEVIPPSLVIPLVSGSHVQDGSKAATVLLDQVKDNEALDKTIWNSLIGYLEDRNVAVENFDPETGKLVTGWMVLNQKDEESSWFNWSSDTETPATGRYEFELAMKPHGRTAQLSVSLKDFKHGQTGLSDLTSMQRRRDEVAVLNRVIGHYEYLNQLATNQRIALIRFRIAKGRINGGFQGDRVEMRVAESRIDLHGLELPLRRDGEIRIEMLGIMHQGAAQSVPPDRSLTPEQAEDTGGYGPGLFVNLRRDHRGGPAEQRRQRRKVRRVARRELRARADAEGADAAVLTAFLIISIGTGLSENSRTVRRAFINCKYCSERSTIPVSEYV